MKLRTILVLFVSHIGCLCVSQNLEFKGRVFERTEEFNERHIEKAQVEILNENDVIVATTTTNESGYFRTLINNKYRYREVKIIVTASGYNTHRSSGKFQDTYRIELFPVIKESYKPPIEINKLPKKGQDVIRLQREINRQNTEIEGYRTQIEELRKEQQELVANNQASDEIIEKLNQKIASLENIVNAIQESKTALINEKGAMKAYIELLEAENDSLISVIERIEEAEKVASRIYVNNLEVYAANEKNRLFSDKPNRVRNFEDWTRTIVSLDIEQLNGNPLEEPIKLILKIRHIESETFMKYAEGDGNDEVQFYYQTGEKQIVFSNYESKNRFYGEDPKFMVTLYIENGNSGLREIYKTRLILKN